MFRSCTAISVASAHLTARLARHRKCQDLRLKWDFGSLRAVSATFAVQRLRGERQAKFRGIETGLGKNRSASAGRFFVAQQAHVPAFRLGCLIAVRKFGGVLCRRTYCVKLRGGHCLLRLGARGYAELNKKIERVPVLWCRSGCAGCIRDGCFGRRVRHSRAVDGLHGNGVCRRRSGRQHRLDVLEPGCRGFATRGSIRNRPTR